MILAAREVSAMTVPLKFNPSTAWGARHGLHPDLLRRVASPGSGRIFPFSDEAIAVEARSFAREHAWLGGIDLGYDHPFDELIYLPAAEWPVQAKAKKTGITQPDRVWRFSRR
jgi:hypothetical protein